MSIFPHIDTHFNSTGFTKLTEHVAKKFPAAALSVAVREATLTVSANQIVSTLSTLATDKATQFTQLIDICGVDYLGHTPAQPARFAVVYHLLSLTHNQRLRVKVWLNDGDAIPTVTGVFPAAGWYERETYDMFGIVFTGHPDLRRLLTDYDFVGFPLRKDFPLEGHVEVYYDATQQRVAYKPVDLPQPFRNFDGVSGWQGATGNAHLADTDNTFKREEFE